MLEFESSFGYLGLKIIPLVRGFEIEVSVPGYDDIEFCGPYAPSLHNDRWRYRISQSGNSGKGLLTGFVGFIQRRALPLLNNDRVKQ